MSIGNLKKVKNNKKTKYSENNICMIAGNDVTGVIIKGRTLSHVMMDFERDLHL